MSNNTSEGFKEFDFESNAEVNKYFLRAVEEFMNTDHDVKDMFNLNASIKTVETGMQAINEGTDYLCRSITLMGKWHDVAIIDEFNRITLAVPVSNKPNEICDKSKSSSLIAYSKINKLSGELATFVGYTIDALYNTKNMLESINKFSEEKLSNIK